MTFLANRDRQDEWMDQPDLSASMHADALRGLARVNRLSGVSSTIWSVIELLASRNPTNAPIRVLDVATGGGDVAIGIKRLAQTSGIAIELTACDISQTALDYASRQASSQQLEIAFAKHDALADPGTLSHDRFDVVYSSLFLHHLESPKIVEVLQAMRRLASQRIVISDLLRTRIGYAFAWFGIRLLTSSPVCHVDGPLSVRAALTIEEINDLARQAGLNEIRISRKWPERFLLVARP